MGSACRVTGADCSRGSVKITFLLTQSLESPSGLGRYWPVAKELRRLGHRVTILALHHDWKSLTQRRFVRDGVEVRYVGQMHVRKVGDTKLYFGRLELLTVVVRATLGLLCEALRVSTDAYHVGKPHPMNGVAGLVASRLRRKPLYLDCDDYEAASNRFGGEWQRRIVAFFEDRLPRYADGVTANTKFTVRRLLSQLQCRSDRVFYVPNGVDRERFSAPDPVRISELARELAIGNSLVVLYVGSLSLASHSVDLLVDAFPYVLASCSSAVLVLVGGGEDILVLKRRASELGISQSVRFVGRVAPDQVSAYYSLAHVVVDPVADDQAAEARSPLKVVESLACGTPVVTSDVGDRRAMLNNGELGFITAPGAAAELAEGVVRLLCDASERARASAAALVLRDAWYWDRLVWAFAQVYRHY